MRATISRRDFVKLVAAAPVLKYAMDARTSVLPQSDPGQPTDKPNILILVFDTLSANHMSLYGYDRITTPNFARFAEQATVYHNHYAAGNFTTPGTASMLTGTYPWAHRAINIHATIASKLAATNLFGAAGDEYHRVAYTHNALVMALLHQFKMNLDLLVPVRDLSIEDLTLTEILAPNDYPVAFLGYDLAMWRGGLIYGSFIQRMRRNFTRRQVWATHGEQFPHGVGNWRNHYYILEDAFDWLAADITGFSNPFMAYVHVFPPHAPYLPRREFLNGFKGDGFSPIEKPQHRFSDGVAQGELNRLRRSYDEFIAYTDSEFGRLMDTLERNNVMDNTYVIITSDHGESFERGIPEHTTPVLYEPLLKVPLLISAPGQRERIDVTDISSAVDILPTVMSMIGRPIPDGVEGRVLAPFAEGSPKERKVYAMEAKRNPKRAQLATATFAMYRDNYKLIHYRGLEDVGPGYELYNVADDPEELNDLYGPDSAVSREMRDELTTKVEQVDGPLA